MFTFIGGMIVGYFVAPFVDNLFRQLTTKKPEEEINHDD